MQKSLIYYAARSDKGCARRNNEDNLFCCGAILTSDIRDLPFKIEGKLSAPAILAVFDGIGGEQLGEHASLTAVRTLQEHADRLLNAGSDLDEAVKLLVRVINQRLTKEAIRMSARMGTTMALAVISHDLLRTYNIGDSRIYTYDHKSGLKRISVDHTLAMLRVDAGLMTEAEARQSHDWHKLTACLGIPGENGVFSEPQINPVIPLSEDMKILLCSDGLTDMVEDDRIERILGSADNIPLAVQDLMSEALNNGGRDNTTIIAAEIQTRKSLLGGFLRKGGKS